MTIDLERARRDTPGCAHVVHLNNAGAALMPRPVLETVTEYLQLEARIGGYEAAAARAEQLEAVYGDIAQLIGASPDEIAVVENATRAWDMAFYSLSFQPGDRILTAEAEYASNYIAYLQVARKFGAVVEVVPSDPSGAIDAVSLREMIDDRVKLISITHVPTNGGLVNPAEEVGAVAQAAGIPFLLDACQSVGQLDIDVGKIGCDMLSATSRKYLRGPRGMGFLYVRRSLIEKLEPPFLDLHAACWESADSYRIREDARRFENWETNFAAKLGMGEAARYALALGLPAIEARVAALADRLRQGLDALPGVAVCDLGRRRCGLVTFTSGPVGPTELNGRLRKLGFNTSVSRQRSTRLDMERRSLQEVLRASPHYYLSEEEIDRFVEAVDQSLRS